MNKPLMLLLAAPAKSQVFLDEQTRETTQYQNLMPQKKKNPDRGMSGYAPLGGGVLCLGLLGGAYLIAKRKKNED